MFKSALFSSVILASSLFSADHVVCIHGFMGAPWNMRLLEKNLNADGWDTINWGYCSRDDLITAHGKRLAEELEKLAKKKPGRPIHFVAHSMGGLVLLSALNHPSCPNEAKVGKIVLIASPMKGSQWARWLSQFSLVRSVAKDFSGEELMTKSDFDDLGDFPDSLDKVLVIAGSFGFNPIFEGENDGTVAVEETILSTPHEHVVVKRGHKTIVFSPKVSKLVTRFLGRT